MDARERHLSHMFTCRTSIDLSKRSRQQSMRERTFDQELKAAKDCVPSENGSAERSGSEGSTEQPRVPSGLGTKLLRAFNVA